MNERKGKGKPIIKVGDVHLRRALMNALYTLRLHQPVLRRYYHQLSQSKPAGVASVATARRANGILWATLRDQRAETLLLKRGAAM